MAQEPPAMPEQELRSQKLREALQQALMGLAPNPVICNGSGAMQAHKPDGNQRGNAYT